MQHTTFTELYSIPVSSYRAFFVNELILLLLSKRLNVNSTQEFETSIIRLS